MTEDQGYHVEQDELGRFTEGTTLSSERAREIRSGPHRKQRDQDAAALADAILATMREPDNQEFRDTARELLVRAASGIATKQGGSSMAALTSLSAVIREAFASKPGPSMLAPGPDDACPLCRRVDARSLSLTADAQAYLRGLLRANAELLLKG